MKLALAIVGEYVMTILKIIGFIVWLPILIAGFVIAQILAWFKI
jgi:hypothetical protein